jgi:hypothetical protein
LEKDNSIETSFDEEHDSHEIDALFLIEKHRWDKDCFHFDGDPIYDTDDDSSRAKIADFWSLGKPHRLEFFIKKNSAMFDD